MSVAAILVAAGSGQRLGAAVPKAFVPVAGATLAEHAVRRFVAHPAVSRVVLVVPAGWEDTVAEPGVVVVGGGATRQQSVDCGLRAVGDEADAVLVHDVARAFVPDAVISRVVAELAAGADAVVPVVPVADSIRAVDETGSRPVDRAALRAVQTPQGFTRAALLAAHAGAVGTGATDDAALAEAAGYAVRTVEGSAEAFKITHQLDLALAEAMTRR